MRTRTILFVLSGMALVGCGGEAFQTSEPPVSQDASADAVSEASSEAAADAATDAPADATPDEAAPDVSPDVAADVLPEVAPDAPEPEAGCTDGDAVPCYEGPPGTIGKGVCKAGTTTCESGTWSQCEGQVLPSPDICNSVDDDCDGTIDANCSCTPGESQNCGTDAGECQMGTQTCTSAGTWGECEGAIDPVLEVCDSKDNDCNGVEDDAIATSSCYTGPAGTQGIGLCIAGSLTCVSGQQLCANQVLPSQEICGNGVDEDCDGQDLGCTVCTEKQPVVFPSACGATCLMNTSTDQDTDCDGMAAGDPSQACNTLKLFEGFVQEPDSTVWTRTGTTLWQCGGMLLGPGSSISTSAPVGIAAAYITEARVALKEAVAGNWTVGISSAVDTNQRRTCELWVNSSYTGGKLQAHMNVKSANCDSGGWTQVPNGLDASPGKVYILRLSASSAGQNLCQVLDETGTQLLTSTSINCTFPTAGNVTAYASVRAAVLDYMSVYSW